MKSPRRRLNRVPANPVIAARRVGPPSLRARRSAFTLVELLVVIGIMLLLMGILLPSLSKAYTTAIRSRMALDLQTISTSLEAYRSDFDQYPQIPVKNGVSTGQGAYWLCRALVGPGSAAPAGDTLPAGDGADGLGFKVKTGGKVWGPYLPDTFKMGDPSGQNNLNKFVLYDRNRHPILYYPGKKGTDITQAGGYLGPKGMFNPADNVGAGSSDSVTGTMSAQMFMILMGDGGYDSGSGTPTAPNGKIDAGETPAYTGNYVLVSAGPDEKFGPTGDPTQPQEGTTWRASPRNPCDDVTNFAR